MMTLRKYTIKERLFRLWPAYRRRMDAETKAAIKWLVEHPEAPCKIGETFIPNGFGDRN